MCANRFQATTSVEIFAHPISQCFNVCVSYTGRRIDTCVWAPHSRPGHGEDRAFVHVVSLQCRRPLLQQGADDAEFRVPLALAVGAR